MGSLGEYQFSQKWLLTYDLPAEETLIYSHFVVSAKTGTH